MDSTYALFIGICAFNPALQNIGMGFQKWSIDHMPQTKGPAEKALWVGVWILGLLMQIFVVVLAFKALTLGNASTLGGFGGLGLIFLAVFSLLVLKEEILKKEYMGMALIVAGTIVLGYFSQGSQNPEVELETGRLVLFFSVYLALVAVGIFILTRNLRSYGGAILGIIGGSMNGVGLVFQKVVTAAFKNMNLVSLDTLLKILASPYTWIMIVGGVGGFIVIQFGYKYGKAVQVVPGYAALIIVVPAVAGMAILGEIVPPVCLAAITAITVGAIVTTTAAPFKHKA